MAKIAYTDREELAQRMIDLLYEKTAWTMADTTGKVYPVVSAALQDLAMKHFEAFIAEATPVIENQSNFHKIENGVEYYKNPFTGWQPLYS